MTKHLVKDDTVSLKCRHCSSPTLEVIVKEASMVKQCSSCGGDTIVRVERRTGRWEIHTGLLPRNGQH